jgi:threonine synthase
MSEGKKTVAFEMCEQLAWQVPDLVFVPVGNGCILGSVYKGFFDLLQLGWIERMPRLIGVQAQNSNFMYRAWRSDQPMQQTERITPTSLASSINVALPRDRLKALRAVTASEGEFGVQTGRQHRRFPRSRGSQRLRRSAQVRRRTPRHAANRRGADHRQRSERHVHFSFRYQQKPVTGVAASRASPLG